MKKVKVHERRRAGVAWPSAAPLSLLSRALCSVSMRANSSLDGQLQEKQLSVSHSRLSSGGRRSELL